jgi:hypothetical protein
MSDAIGSRVQIEALRKELCGASLETNRMSESPQLVNVTGQTIQSIS